MARQGTAWRHAHGGNAAPAILKTERKGGDGFTVEAYTVHGSATQPRAVPQRRAAAFGSEVGGVRAKQAWRLGVLQKRGKATEEGGEGFRG